MSYRGRGFNLDVIWVIIGINVLVFIAANIFHSVVPLLGLWPLGFIHQPWTIVTNLFTHVDLWHILFNMLTFYFFGTFLIRLVGQTRFLIIYFGGGILGNIFYMLLAPPFSIAIGASGAIFALGGALAVLTPNLRVFVFPIPVPLPLWAAVIGGFVILSILAPVLNIAWQAHLGGLVFGLVAGYFFKRRGRYYF